MSNKNNIKNSVMDSIKSGKTHMKPKVYYTLISASWLVLIGLLSVVSVYVISIVSFWLRIAMAQGPAYGAKKNLSSLIDSFPWWLVLLSFIVTFVIIYLMRKHSKLYKIKLWILVPVTLMSLVLAGYLLSYSNFVEQHNNYNQTQGHQK